MHTFTIRLFFFFFTFKKHYCLRDSETSHPPLGYEVFRKGETEGEFERERGVLSASLTQRGGLGRCLLLI